MSRIDSRLVRLAWLSAMFAATMPAAGRVAQGEEATNDPAPQEQRKLDSSNRLLRVEEQLRKLESHNRQLQKRYDELSRQYQNFVQQGNDPIFGARMGNPDGVGVPGGIPYRRSSFVQKSDDQDSEGAGESIGEGRQRTYEPEEEGEERESKGEAAPALPPRPRRRSQTGESGAGIGAGPEFPQISMEDYVNQLDTYQPDMRPPRLPLTAAFRQGLQLQSADNFFTLEFHNLTQFDYRDFSNTGAALHDNFVIPRERWYFQGQLTPYVYYYTVINRGYGTVDLLDAWADFNFSPSYKELMEIRVGRMKTPFNYEYIKISDSDIIAPERSILVSNYSGNREDGVMFHGRLFDRTLEYFVGVFNGPQRSFNSYTNSKTLYTFLNAKPFLHSGVEWLEQLNLSGFWNGGYQNDPLQPTFLSTANDQTTSATAQNAAPTFLVFNDKAFENGMRMFWGGDVAYYYKSLTMYAGYQDGFVNYSLYNTPLPSNTIFYEGSTAWAGYGSSRRTTVPIMGWNAALTYFITGEEITRRVYLVEPKRPFGYYNGRLNPGAIELYARIADMQLGDQVFTGGIANSKYWTNRVAATDIGVNWYLNNYVRIYLDWQHAMYGSPVYLDTDKYTKHENLYWLRTQIFF